MPTTRSFILAAASILALSQVAAAAIAPPDREAPTRPNHLRITSATPYSVSLAWNPSTDNGAFSYVIRASNGYSMVVPQTSTTAVFSTNLFPLNTYSFSVYAVDSSNNQSSPSNTVRTTLAADTTAPSTPIVTLTDTGPTHISLSWSTTDNCPYPSYFVYINGVQVGHSTTSGTGIICPLSVSTAYTVTVKARDLGLNFSPLSAPLVVSTDPINTNDTIPPTAPTNPDPFHYPGDREIMLSWGQSTDNFDIQPAIRYEVYVNGILSENVVGVGSTTTYGEFGHNTITIIAFDTAGNPSDPVSVELDI